MNVNMMLIQWNKKRVQLKEQIQRTHERHWFALKLRKIQNQQWEDLQQSKKTIKRNVWNVFSISNIMKTEIWYLKIQEFINIFAVGH